MSELQALNYCAHAIDDLLEKASKSESGTLKVKYQAIAKLMRLSAKILISNSTLLKSPSELANPTYERFQLPFPITAFEIDYRDAEPHQRIILSCLAYKLPMEFGILRRCAEKHNNDGAFLFFLRKEKNGWDVNATGVFVPYKNAIKIAEDNSVDFTGEPFKAIPEKYFMNDATQKANANELIVDAENAYDAFTLIAACYLAAQTDISQESLMTNDKLNKPREAKGKQSFFNYHVI